MQRFLIIAATMVIALCVSSQGWTETVHVLGEQDFTDGTLVTDGDYADAQAGEPYPFDGTKGFDANLADEPGTYSFAANWTHSGYGPLVGDVVAASITIGIREHDSAAAGDQVASFLAGGIDLTTEMNGLFEGSGGSTVGPPFAFPPQSEYNVYTLNLPSSTYLDLADGSITFYLEMQNGSVNGVDVTDTNSAGLDFSTLRITTREGQPVVPEPSVLAGLLGMAAVGLLGYARRRRRNRA